MLRWARMERLSSGSNEEVKVVKFISKDRYGDYLDKDDVREQKNNDS